MAWVSSWVSTTSRPRRAEAAHALRHDDDAVGARRLTRLERTVGDGCDAGDAGSGHGRAGAPRQRRCRGRSRPRARPSPNGGDPTGGGGGAPGEVGDIGGGAHDEEQGAAVRRDPQSLEIPRLGTVGRQPGPDAAARARRAVGRVAADDQVGGEGAGRAVEPVEAVGAGEPRPPRAVAGSGPVVGGRGEWSRWSASGRWSRGSTSTETTRRSVTSMARIRSKILPCAARSAWLTSGASGASHAARSPRSTARSRDVTSAVSASTGAG